MFDHNIDAASDATKTITIDATSPVPASTSFSVAVVMLSIVPLVPAAVVSADALSEPLVSPVAVEFVPSPPVAVVESAVPSVAVV